MKERLQGEIIDKNSRFYAFNDLLTSVAERGLSLIDTRRYRREGDLVESLLTLCELLLTSKGEASGIAMAREALTLYERLDEPQKAKFFSGIIERFGGDWGAAGAAASKFVNLPSHATMIALNMATRPLSRELLERLNQAPDATLSLVRMRADLRDAARADRSLASLDQDFVQLFSSWFNRGFLELKRIDWNAPANLLEKIMAYEAVHHLDGWNDLRRRILPADRCLYGFFHPRLGSEPLIFVEVALTNTIPNDIKSILESDRKEIEAKNATTAVFYSISNCQTGLRGISLGSFLIKQVVADLRQRFGRLRTFVTLSPIPAFARWMRTQYEENKVELSPTFTNWDDLCNSLAMDSSERKAEALRVLETCAAYFLLHGRDDTGQIIDPVARFHLGNGAILERVNVLADQTQGAMDSAVGTMVNYLYAFDRIEEHHEKFVNSGTIASSQRISRLAKNAPFVHNR